MRTIHFHIYDTNVDTTFLVLKIYGEREREREGHRFGNSAREWGFGVISLLQSKEDRGGSFLTGWHVAGLGSVVFLLEGFETVTGGENTVQKVFSVLQILVETTRFGDTVEKISIWFDLMIQIIVKHCLLRE